MLQIDARKLKQFDYTLFLAVVAISLLGAYTISTTGKGDYYAIRQLFWVGVGVVLSLFVAFMDTRKLKSLAKPFYFGSIVLLLLVFTHGVLKHGAKRWIAFGGVHLQPSEFVKIGVILMLAYYLDENPKNEPYDLKDLIIPFLIIAIPSALIVVQPDLGTTVVIVTVAFGILLFARIRRSLLIKLILLAIIFFPFAWSNLKPYQKDRIMAFINPYSAPTTYGYHIIQSEIAVGSGGLTGKGIAGATQTALNFLPECHTDFIFSVFSEQHGFVGDMVLILLYLFIIFKAIRIAKKAQTNFERFASIGIAVMIWISFVFNIGMTIGLLPVVGVPLVFFSYGGSAMLTNFLCVGILLSIELRSHP